MNFIRRGEIDAPCDQLLRSYDRVVAEVVGADYPFPLRMRDWELYRVLTALQRVPAEARILEIGSFNTYLSAYLAQSHRKVTASDMLRHRWRKSLLRRLGLAPAKPSEAGYYAWKRAVRGSGAAVRDLDASQLDCADASFDCVVALSVIEHVVPVERALAEMYRVLAPGGSLLITTDCAPEPVGYSAGVRYFSPAELAALFAPYPVTSPRNEPDFSPENRCYDYAHPVVTVFIEITKPASSE
jgi:SAM-dependent methyltransferase